MATSSVKRFYFCLFSLIFLCHFPNFSECQLDFIFEAFNIVIDPEPIVLPSNPLVAAPEETVSTDPNDIHFHFFSNPENVNESKEIIYNDTESLATSGFLPNRRTVFITHGFRSNLSSDMPQTLKNAFLAANGNPNINIDNNIVVVNWGKLSTPTPQVLTAVLYNNVTSHINIVAQRLADFIIFLHEKNQLSFNDTHLIGHSLGAHVSGLAGRNIYLATGEKIARVTGLDPAGPGFFPPEPTKNLMKENAIFVDVIHANVGVLGDMSNDGHADFYPNGGTTQAGCQDEDVVSPTTMGRCSHWYAYKLFAASLTQPFPACACENFKFMYPLGLCAATCDDSVRLGYHCPTSTNGEFYLITKPL